MKISSFVFLKQSCEAGTLIVLFDREDNQSIAGLSNCQRPSLLKLDSSPGPGIWECSCVTTLLCSFPGHSLYRVMGAGCVGCSQSQSWGRGSRGGELGALSEDGQCPEPWCNLPFRKGSHASQLELRVLLSRGSACDYTWLV